MGCQTIARYLESLSEDAKAGGVIFVAGFFTKLTGLEEEIKEDSKIQDIADEWMNTPIDLEKVRKHMTRSVAIFSDNDKYVPLSNIDDYRGKLGSEIIIEKNKGHFAESDGMNSFPLLLEKLLEISK